MNKNMRIVSVLILLVLLQACAWTTPEPAKTQLQIRQDQTRVYNTTNDKLVMKMALDVLQDQGFIVKEANTELGFITATKEVDLDANNSGAFFSSLSSNGQSYTFKKNKIIESTTNVTVFGQTTKIRVNFQEKVFSNKGEVVRVRPIEDAQFYQEFFAKVDKGLFLASQNL
ncbi:MAG: hypothetical protein KDD52_04890 [Bdellovibrionales bacterium]|nr:hypothetical protein [Bdellovibrionales bacterium]